MKLSVNRYTIMKKYHGIPWVYHGTIVPWYTIYGTLLRYIMVFVKPMYHGIVW